MPTQYNTTPKKSRHDDISSFLTGPMTFLDVLADLHAGNSGVVVFGRKDKAAPGCFRTLGGGTVDEVRTHHQALQESLKLDGYWTINTVFRGNGGRFAPRSRAFPELRYYRRRTGDLEKLNAAYVDIDCGKLDFEPSYVAVQAFDLLSKVALPYPTHLCFSGCGVWLLWRFVKSVQAWPEACDFLKRLNQQIVRMFADLGADPSSTDAARIMRCPETLNSKNGQEVRFFRVAGASSQGFPELLRAFNVPAQKTKLPGEKQKNVIKNPRRVAAGRLRYSRRLHGLLDLRRIRGSFKPPVRRPAIFCLALLMFKTGAPKALILAECLRFARESCSPPITDDGEVRRRVNYVFRYDAHITDAWFVQTLQITESEMSRLSDWFRQKKLRREPLKLRVARRRAVTARECESLDPRLTDYKRAQVLVEILEERHGIAVSFMTVQRDLAALNIPNNSLLKDSPPPPPFKQENVGPHLTLSNAVSLPVSGELNQPQWSPR